LAKALKSSIDEIVAVATYMSPQKFIKWRLNGLSIMAQGLRLSNLPNLNLKLQEAFYGFSATDGQHHENSDSRYRCTSKQLTSS
jgi:hypothetical protein